MDEQPPAGVVPVTLEIPVALDRDAPAPCAEVVPLDRLRVAALVRCGVEAAAVHEPHRLVEPRVVVVRRNVLGVAGRDVDDVEIVVAGTSAVVLDDELTAVRRETNRRVPAAGCEELALVVPPQRSDDHRPVDAVLPVRRICEQGAIPAQARVAVDELRLDDKRLLLCFRDEPELRVLVPLVVALEQDQMRPVDQLTVDGIGSIRDLHELAAGEWHRVQLHRARQVAADQQRVV